MKKWLLIAVVLTLATAAVADQVTLQLENAPYGQTGPYTMKVDGILQQLVCGSDLNFITGGESWTAKVYTLATIGTNPYFPTDPAKWNQASLFADLLLTHPGNAVLQNDVWASLGLPVGPIDAYWGGIVQGILDTGYQTTDLFYIPVEYDYAHDPNYPYGVPQPFFGPVPEPTSLVLFGSGLIAVGGVMRRKFRV